MRSRRIRLHAERQNFGVRKLCAVFLSILFLSAITPMASEIELSIVATADSYTESDHPDVNHGGASTLYSHYYEYELLNKTYRYEQHIWLKFDLSEIPSDVTVNSIALRMHTSLFTSTTNKVGVFFCSNTDWEEMEITWNNAPEVTGQPIDTENVGSYYTYYNFNVTSAVKGKDVITLVLKTLESTKLAGWADFHSKESTVSYRPRLVVEYTVPYPYTYPTPEGKPPTSEDEPILDFTSLIIVGIVAVISAVIVVVAYVITKRKKLPSSSATSTKALET